MRQPDAADASGWCQPDGRTVPPCDSRRQHRRQSSSGGRRRRLTVPRCVLDDSRFSRAGRLGRVGRRGGGSGASAAVTSASRRAAATSRLRASERSAWLRMRSGRSSSPSRSARRSACWDGKPSSASPSMTNSARVDALSRCCPPGPLERLAPHCARWSSCSVTSLVSNRPPYGSEYGTRCQFTAGHRASVPTRQ